MKVRRDQLAAKATQWVARAEDDLRVARHTLTLKDDCPYRLVAYHAQQCAEKYLKAYLVIRGVDFPFTHDIARLRELCLAQANWPAQIEDADELTPFAITARYPADDEPVSEAEALRAVNRSEVRLAPSACDTAQNWV